MTSWIPFLVAVAASASMTAFATRWASRAGLADDPSSAPGRKLQARPVPAVGGFAILAGMLAAKWAGASLPLSGGAAIAILLAFLVGAIDDRRRGGLSAPALLVGQTIVAAALLLGGWRICGGAPPLAAAASLFAVLAAINALNAFDNADGAATSLGILGLSAGTSVLAAPLVGFLPWNLLPGGGTRPAAYLGNSGSFVLGVLLLLDPVGRYALVLPLLDLTRLVFVRTALGSRPWVGDRRHLAHRLQRAGLSSLVIVLVLCAVAAPAVIAGRSGERAALLGVLATVLLAGAAVVRTPRVG